MLELKNVSKFYYSKGIVSSGFSKVSLKFELGEFVAITGESGSGKSTLLNVISGLDSYEEGEMYIFGNETSHYTEKDYEIYRRKYIGNIFQNFNLINSYTVYQNIELVLLLNGFRKKEIKNKIIDIIKKVDLYSYRNKKVSKLSGGQKQRVAIARALAMDSPIILADEPTGNLDKNSARSVLKLLHEISQDKLVIVVTHNYDQIEEYVTRKITMHDGRVFEDKIIKEINKVSDISPKKYTSIKWYNKISLATRNAFNILSKFLLITAVYLFIVFSLFSAYASFSKSQYDAGISGVNNFFPQNDDKRIIIKKKDKSSFTEEDYEKISKLSNVDKIVKNDLLIDEMISINDNDQFYLYGNVSNISEIKNVDFGSMPKEENEIIVSLNEYMFDYYKNIVGNKLVIDNLYDTGSKKKYEVIVSGIISTKSGNSKFYVNDKIQEDISKYVNKNNTTLKYKFYDINEISYLGNIYGEILPSNRVDKGKVVISEDWIYKCKNFKCKDKNFQVNVSNIYYNFNVNFKVYNNYDKKNFNKLTGYKYDTYNGAIFINSSDYNNLFNKGIYQSSLFIKNVKEVRSTLEELEDMGIKTAYLPDITFPISEEISRILNIVKVIFISGLIIALFFISYFIIKLILKSRNVYYSTLRILGAESKTTNDLLAIELLVLSHISYVIFVLCLLFSKYSNLNLTNIKELMSFVSLDNYLLIYIILMIMTLLISSRYARKLFKNTVMNTYKEEV